MKKQKNNFIITIFIIIIVFILLSYLTYNKYIKEYFTNKNVIDIFEYYDEKNNKIDHKNEEYTEQLQAQKYINPDSVVLELGARYGTVSCTINSKLNNKNNQVSVEPDSVVWDALESNMKKNNLKFNIVKGFISSTPLELEGEGYSLSFKDVKNSSINNFTLDNIEEQYNLKFDTLVADCEGCLERFFDENPKLYNQLRLVIMEEDQPQKCNYKTIKNSLTNSGFSLIEENFNIVNRSVWKKNII
jgi:FkbM family methyltransferase